MKKYKFLSLSTIIVFLIYAVINLIVFLTVKPEAFETARFWIIWGFSFLGSFLVILFTTIYNTAIKKYEAILIPPTLIIGGAFSLVYVISGFIMVYQESTDFILPLILYSIITVIYIIVLAYVFFTASYIQGNVARQEKKVFYIRDLVTDVQYVMSNVTDSSVLDQLKKLEEQIRFSDPMSHDSLEGLELEIKDKVQRMASLPSDDKEGLEKLIKEISSQINYRNLKCKSLK